MATNPSVERAEGVSGFSGYSGTAGAAGTSGFSGYSGAASSGEIIYQSFSHPGSTGSNTDVYFSIGNATTNANPPTFATSTSGNDGLDNGNISPWIAPFAGTITEIVLTKARSAVSQGTQGGAMTARIEIFRSDYATRTSLGFADIAVSSSNVFSSVSGDQYEKGLTATTSISVAQGDALSVQFTSRSANNNECNGLGGALVSLKLEKS